MVVHICLFYLKDTSTAPEMVAALNEIPKQNPAIVHSFVGANRVVLPPIPGIPDFADVAQVITFENEEDAAAYDSCKAHMTMRGKTDHLIDHVCAAEFVQ